MRVRIEHGDCRNVVLTIADCAVDFCITDPPYSLVSIQKRFGKPGSAPVKSDGASGVYKRASAGFMGKQWDTGETSFDADWWREIYRVLKPGAHLIAFSGTRTYHRMACAIEDAGFEIRDQIAWTYGSGFPKSHNVGNGWGTALKPAWEPIVLARKPLVGTVAANVLAHGTGALNIDRCRVAPTGESRERAGEASQDRRYAETGGRNFAATPGVRGGDPSGRWPANLVHDGSDEVLEAFGSFGERTSGHLKAGTRGGAFGQVYRDRCATPLSRDFGGDAGSAARFFFSAKADADDRVGSKHPTVKPVSLMRWLVRLVTPPGGLVLDPFAGTGTTGVACIREGMRAVLIEREDEYVADIRRRLDMLSGLDTPLLAGAAE